MALLYHLLLGVSIATGQLEIISLYPSQNHLTAQRETDLYAVFNLDLDESTVVDTNIVVFAERTGTHFGTLIYNVDSRTLTFDPDNDFIAGERVRVTLTNKIRGASGESFRGFTWHFTVQTFANEEFEFVYKGDIAAGLSLYLDAADFNNDGYPDVFALQNIYYQRVYLFLNNQNGGFYYYDTILETDVGLINPVVVDFDKNGWVDIYIAGSHIFVMNQGDGEFEVVYADSLLINSSFGATTDFNNDGNMDIMASVYKKDSVCVYRGQDHMQFELDHCWSIPDRAQFDTPAEEVFDLNNDGLVDIITPIDAYEWDSIMVLINEGGFAFRDPGIYDPITFLAYGWEYGNDLDGDGDLDYVLFGKQRSDSARFFLYNNGEGEFTFGDYIPPRHAIGSVFGGDLDADGDIDLLTDSVKVFSVMPLVREGHIYILRNDGLERFTPVRDYIVGDRIERSILVDYDLDGDLDIVGISEPRYSLFWMENTSILPVKEGAKPRLPDGFHLFQNYPNPFNESTKITYQIPESVQVTIKIYDINGREVKTAVNQIHHPGKHRIRWDGSDNFNGDVGSGIYFIQLNAGQFAQTRKIVLLR